MKPARAARSKPSATTTREILTPGLRAAVLREWQPLATEPVPAASGLDRLVPEVMKRLGLDQRLWESELCGNWDEIVGELNARLCQPSILRHGLLTITVSHPAYIQELRPLKALFLSKIQQRFGKKSVRDIIFRVG